MIRGPNRDGLQEFLKENGVGSEIYYPLPLHLQPCYSQLGHKKGDFPVSERMAADSLALPVHSELAPEDVDYICDAIRAFTRTGLGQPARQGPELVAQELFERFESPYRHLHLAARRANIARAEPSTLLSSGNPCAIRLRASPRKSKA